MIKILQVFSEYSEVGGEQLWVDHVGWLAGKNYEVNDLRFRSRAWKKVGRPGVFRQILFLNRNPHALHRLREEVSWMKPDVILFHNVLPVCSVSIFEEAKNLGIPIVRYIHNFRPFSPSGTMWTGNKVNDASLRGNVWPEILHGSWEGSRIKTAILAFFQRRLNSRKGLELVDHWIAVSEFMRDKFIEAGIPENRISALPHCWQMGSNSTPAQESDYYLFLGRIVTEKGIDTLITAWKILAGESQNRIPRLMIAGIGPASDRVIKAATDDPNIEYLGYVSGEHKQDLIRGCRALLAPSVWWEPLGLIVHEAYEAKRPMIAARSGGLEETVTEGFTGFLHQPGDASQLANAIRRMEAIGVEGRAKMGAAGYQWLGQKASPELWQDRFYEIIQKAIQQSKQTS